MSDLRDYLAEWARLEERKPEGERRCVNRGDGDYYLRAPEADCGLYIGGNLRSPMIRSEFSCAHISDRQAHALLLAAVIEAVEAEGWAPAVCMTGDGQWVGGVRERRLGEAGTRVPMRVLGSSEAPLPAPALLAALLVALRGKEGTNG